MIPILESKRDELNELCRRFHVAQLEVFGSATNGEFDSQRSDIDFLVRFNVNSPQEHFESYFGLMEELEQLFGRRIDLVEEHVMKNPHFIRRVNETRNLLYAA